MHSPHGSAESILVQAEISDNQPWTTTAMHMPPTEASKTSVVLQLARKCTLRGLLRFKTATATAIPLEEVESAAEIVKRFVTGACTDQGCFAALAL